MPSERALLTTKLVDAMLRRLRAWNWCSVLRKVAVWCLAYLVLLVGVMKVTTVFMSWLVATIEPMPLEVSTAIFVCVGLMMFLNPACPGAPVYMASGVLMTAAARDKIGYVPAMLFAMAVGRGARRTARTGPSARPCAPRTLSWHR